MTELEICGYMRTFQLSRQDVLKAFKTSFPQWDMLRNQLFEDAKYRGHFDKVEIVDMPMKPFMGTVTINLKDINNEQQKNKRDDNENSKDRYKQGS